MRVFTRDSEDYIALSWEARAVWHELVRKFDHRGYLEMRRGRRALAALIRVPADVVDGAIGELVADGRLVELPTGYLAPDHEAAQTAVKSGRLRMAEARARSRASQSVAPRHSDVTFRNEEVTKRHGVDPPVASQSVAPRHPDVTFRNEEVTKRHGTLEIRPDLSLRISPDLQAPPPELPDPRTIVAAEHGAPVRAPGQIPAVSSVPDRRIKLNHQAWTYAATEHARLRAAGISPSAVAWPALPAGAPMGDLVKRTAEVLAMSDPPDYEAAWAMIKRRIDVAAAEAARVGNLKWFTPSCMWGGDVGRGFWRALEFTPGEAAEPRLPAGARPPTEPIPRRIKTLP